MSWLTELIKRRYEYKTKVLNDFIKRRNEEEDVRKNKERYRLVHQRSENWKNINEIKKTEIKFKIYFSLYENKFGDRKYEVHVNDRKIELEDQYKYGIFYIEYIAPWLEGAYVSGINSYDEAGMDEMADRLKK